MPALSAELQTHQRHEPAWLWLCSPAADLHVSVTHFFPFPLSGLSLLRLCPALTDKRHRWLGAAFFIRCFFLLLVFFTLSFLQFIEQQQCLTYINLKYLLSSMGISLA